MKLSGLLEWGSVAVYIMGIAAGLCGRYDVAAFNILMAIYLKLFGETCRRRGD